MIADRPGLHKQFSRRPDVERGRRSRPCGEPRPDADKVIHDVVSHAARVRRFRTASFSTVSVLHRLTVDKGNAGTSRCRNRRKAKLRFSIRLPGGIGTAAPYTIRRTARNSPSRDGGSGVPRVPRVRRCPSAPDPPWSGPDRRTGTSNLSAPIRRGAGPPGRESRSGRRPADDDSGNDDERSGRAAVHRRAGMDYHRSKG